MEDEFRTNQNCPTSSTNCSSSFENCPYKKCLLIELSQQLKILLNDGLSLGDLGNDGGHQVEKSQLSPFYLASMRANSSKDLEGI